MPTDLGRNLPGRGQAVAEQQTSWLELGDAFGTGIYLLFCVVHLDLYLRRRDRVVHLFLALASAGALLVDATGIVLRRLQGEGPALVVTLNFLGASRATAALSRLVLALGHREPAKVGQVAEKVLLLLPVALPFCRAAVVPYLLLLFGMLAASAAQALQAARQGDQESGTVARGFLVLLVCLGADVWKELKLLPVPAGLRILGFTVLFLAAARSVNNCFDREEQESRTDLLTGLKNRRGFLEAWDASIKRQRRSAKPISVILADLDHFKQVNDALGHAAGDNVLKQIAQALVSHLREQDTVGRWGGEEFVILLPETDLNGP